METFSALLAICTGNSPVPGEFPTQRPMTRSFDVYFDLRPVKRLSKQSWSWWFETLSHSLWRHRNGDSCIHSVRRPRMRTVSSGWEVIWISNQNLVAVRDGKGFLHVHCVPETSKLSNISYSSFLDSLTNVNIYWFDCIMLLFVCFLLSWQDLPLSVLCQ